MNIAVIPARGGSKRIPWKNIRHFCGKPIIAYSIEVAQKTGLFRHVIVSTDSEKIADTAKNYGAEVPFVRPTNLSDDFTGTGEVTLHALNWVQEHLGAVEYVCCLYATAPFVQPHYLAEGLFILQKEDAESSFSVTTFPYPIFRALKINERGRSEMFWPEYKNKRSQDFPEAYHDAGQFYWAKTDCYLKNKRFLSDDAIPIVIPRYLVQDIDTFEDWKTAELMFLALQRTNIKTQSC